MIERAVPVVSLLSKDIRYLGDLLGDIIREQQGDAALALVEAIRGAAKARRSGDASATTTLTESIAALSLQDKRVLVKAFANYFQLINIAEDLQRIRTLRDRELTGTLNETIASAVHELHTRGVTAAQMRDLLERIGVRLVLTAHPSEAKRQEMLIKLRDIAEFMVARESATLLPRDDTRLTADILRRIEQLWQTRPTRATRATVEDEVAFGLYFITSAIIDVVVDLYLDLRETLQDHYPAADWSGLPRVLCFASWIGGDRDGNPNVTPEITLATLARLHQSALQVYRQDVDYLLARLTQSQDEVEFADSLKAQLNSASEARYAGEHYRQHLQSISDRLESDTYPNAEVLLADLQLLNDSLVANRGRHSAEGTLQRLIIKVKLFSLHLVPLEIREDARHHTAALTELFRHYRMVDDYGALPEDEKQALLTREIQNPRPLFPLTLTFSEITNRVIATWQMVAAAQHQYGTAAIDTFIASMSQNASDILAMLLFAREVGVAEQIDIVPLFETVDDLQRAPHIMRALFDNNEYRAQLTARGQRQQIMIGYSDSNKDGGYIASNWSLYEAQQTLTETCQAQGVLLELFHGRGGSIGRGGGPSNRAILSQPPGSMQGRIKITEQGEVIAYRYSNADIARRHLQQVMNAALLALDGDHDAQPKPEWRAAMRTLTETSQRAYRAFVYETPGFLEYWQQATPINELASMQIGSRPAKRKAGGFESIRAIPWVFSWMQNRAIIPSWFGVGHALKAFCDAQPDGLALLRTM
ncbi:MAG: phosphoenolpyruvate carboxylase, partial [Armatimonadetes bacterium]|nr:phosphoenolpyruvate carboxylase [Anaerolineae bacterium]